MVAALPQSSLRRRWNVFRALTVAEIRRDRDLTLPGFLRWVVEPLSYMVVYMVLLGAIFNRPRPNYPIFLLAALIPFRFFTECLAQCMGTLKSYGSVMTNRDIPRDVLPFVTVAANIPTLLLSMLLLIPFMLLSRVPFTAALIWVPVVLAILVVLTTGPAYVAALFGLYFPNYRGAVQNLIRVSFFVSTGLVTLQDIPGEELPALIRANPLSSIFGGLRRAILQGIRPDELGIVYPLLLGVFLLAVGLAIYRARQHQLAKEV